MSTVLSRARVILGILLTRALAVLGLGKHVYTCLLANAAKFPNLPVPLPTFKTQIDELDAAETATKSGTKGTVAARRVKTDALATTLELFRAYVQSLCDGLPRAESLALAQLGGMSLAKIGAHAKAMLKALAGPNLTSVTLRANAKLLKGAMRGKILFNWQYTADGKTWIASKSTTAATTTIENLTPKTDYFFQVSVSSRTIEGPWSEMVKFTTD